MDLTLFQAGLAAIAIGGIAGLIVATGLKRIFKIELPLPRPRRRPSRSGLVEKLASLASAIVPMGPDDISENRSSTARAGLEISPTTWWTVRIVIAALFGLLALIVLMSDFAFQGAALAIVLCALGLLLPSIYLLLKRRDWRAEIERELPDALDLMVVAVSAGSSLSTAMALVGEKMDGALARGFRQVTGQSVFTSHTDALMGFARRTDVRPFILFCSAVAQADQTGAPLAGVLSEQAAGLRRRRRLKIEEEANKVTVKMLIPMIFFMLPAALALMIAPFLADAAATFGGIV